MGPAPGDRVSRSSVRDKESVWSMIPETFREETSTVSVNVRCSRPKFRSKSKDTSSGFTVSSIKLAACRGSAKIISCTGLPFMSAMVKD